MNECDGYQIGIEMRLHRALEASDAEKRLDDHIISCPKCREFQETVARIEEVMKRNAQTAATSINWTKLRRRVSTLSKSLRRLFQVTLAPAIILLAIVVFSDIREERAIYAGPKGWGLWAMMVVSFVVLCVLLRRAYRERQSEAIAAQATREGLISFCRREVERQFKHYRAFLWVFSLFIPPWLFFVFLVGNVDEYPPAIFLLFSGAPPAGLLIGAIWAFQAMIRLRREREELS